MASLWMTWALAGVALAGAVPDPVSSVCLLQRTKPGAMQKSLLASRAARNQSQAPAAPVPPNNDDGTWPLRLELTILAGLSELHAGPFGPLPDFISSVQQELCTSVGMPADRLTVLSVREGSTTLDMAFLQKANATALSLALLSGSRGARRADHAAFPRKAPSLALLSESQGARRADYAANASALSLALLSESQGARAAARSDPGIRRNADYAASASALSLALRSESRGARAAAGADPSIRSMVPEESPSRAAAEAAAQPPERVVVDLEILPGHLMSDPTPWMFFRLLLEQLGSGDSTLMTGPLGDLLNEATLIQGALPKHSGPQSDANARAGVLGRGLAALLAAAWAADMMLGGVLI